ncbi:MAG: DAK2 domain-containing protein, partial [Firmicutes bacterium]|nr:DAK2 domain-containing protein [Bacillota bacterium]
MEKVVSKELLLKMVQRIADTIEEHKDHLTELDSAVGDGDHGVSMARGFAAVMSKMDEMKDKDISGILN